MSKTLGAQGDTVEDDNVIPITKAMGMANQEPPFSAEERRELRKMMRQFANLRVACPTARREVGE